MDFSCTQFESANAGIIVFLVGWRLNRHIPVLREFSIPEPVSGGLFVIFPVMGRDFESAVITAGFGGFGLGATPMAIANMTAVTERYGPSPKAFIVVPLVCSFFIDVVNAVIIKLFL